MLMACGITYSLWLKIWCSRMSSPDFMPNGAPVPRPLPFADPLDTVPTPKGLPPGMSPLPKNQLPPGPSPGKSPIDLSKPERSPRRPIDLSKKGFKKPIDVTKPRKVSEPRKSPRTKIKIKWTDVIEHILEDNPSSDGTLPDYDKEPDKDDEYPDENDEPELEQDECADTIRYPELKGKPNGFLVQITYRKIPGYRQNNSFSFPSPDAVVIGRKTYLNSDIYIPVDSQNGFAEEYKEIGMETTGRNTGNATRQYKVQYRTGYRRQGDGRFVWNGWGVWYTQSHFISDFSSFSALWARFGTGCLRFKEYVGTNYFERFPLLAFPCSEEEDSEPQDPNDYDRERDEENMACKWQPSNDPRVESLEIETFTYRKFVGCGFNMGEPVSLFENRYVDLPKCMSDSMLKVLNDIAVLEGEKCIPPKIKFWDSKPGQSSTLYSGTPGTAMLQVALPEGCNSCVIAYDVAAAKADNSLRDLKRIGNGNTSENTAINVGRAWLIDAVGNAIHEDLLWVPKTLLTIPFKYRSQVCKVRLLSKTATVPFVIEDTGDRWELKTEE